MRLLLRSGADPGIENKNGKTPLSIAKERGHELCKELVTAIKLLIGILNELIFEYDF